MSRHRATVPFWVVAVVAPLVLVRSAAWLTGSMPSTSVAAPLPQAVEPQASVAPRLPTPPDPTTAAALAYDAALDLEAPIPTPFGNPGPTRPSVDHADEARRRFELSTIFVSDRVSLATINGRLLRVGDALDEHWTVTQITPASVVISHAEGPSLTLTVRH